MKKTFTYRHTNPNTYNIHTKTNKHTNTLFHNHTTTHTHRQTDRKTHTHTHTQKHTHRQTYRKTHTHTHTHTDNHTQILMHKPLRKNTVRRHRGCRLLHNGRLCHRHIMSSPLPQ